MNVDKISRKKHITKVRNEVMQKKKSILKSAIPSTQNSTIKKQKEKLVLQPREWKYLKFEKLIRDGNIKTIQASGGDVIYDLLSDEKKIFFLKKKLIEEATEAFDARDDIELINELGDVLDVLREILRTAKIRRYKIWQAQRKKAKLRGKFKKGVFCHYIKLPCGLHEKWMEKYEDITNKIEKKQYSDVKKNKFKNDFLLN